jgi:hypothetical protein
MAARGHCKGGVEKFLWKLYVLFLLEGLEENLERGGLPFTKKNKAPGYQDGIIQIYHYAERRFKFALRQYRSMSWPTWAREFPVAWSDIDHDVLETIDMFCKRQCVNVSM